MTIEVKNLTTTSNEIRRTRPSSPPSFWGSLVAILGKDLRIEIRTREIVTTAGFFAALVCVMASVSFYSGPQATARIAPGAIWLAIAFSSILALGRTWQREREEG